MHRELDPLLDQLISMRRNHATTLARLARRVDNDHLPAITVSDGVPGLGHLHDPRRTDTLHLSRVLDEMLTRTGDDLSAAAQVRRAIRHGNYTDAAEAAATFAATLDADLLSIPTLPDAFTGTAGAPLNDRDFLTYRTTLHAAIATLCRAGCGDHDTHVLGDRPAPIAWMWVTGPYERRNPLGETITFGPGTRFLVVGGGADDTFHVVDGDGQYLHVPAHDIASRRPVDADTAPVAPFHHVPADGGTGADDQYATHATTRSLVIDYLHTAPAILTGQRPLPDRFDAAASPVPARYHTDGDWIWSAETAAYVERYDLRLPDELLRRIATLGTPPDVPPDRRRDALDDIADRLVGGNVDAA